MASIDVDISNIEIELSQYDERERFTIENSVDSSLRDKVDFYMYKGATVEIVASIMNHMTSDQLEDLGGKLGREFPEKWLDKLEAYIEDGRQEYRDEQLGA